MSESGQRTCQSVQVIPRRMIGERDARTLAVALATVSGAIPSQPEENGFVGNIARAGAAEIDMDGMPMDGGIGSPLGGRNNIESEQLSCEADGYVALRAGSDGTVDPYFDLTGPLTSAINARLSGEYPNERARF
ncbi:hypothetical protein F4827_004788 [Paraburkholderia bannensis]|uniref:Uncharacterized protein n=1 Tax=Paraburkholderia bannensis TaxID=765414 RepID=A0A7W9WVI5_9BURK|nr:MULTISPECIES: hypothetical protein [Paraburkholderia]MBB3259766.1 hypothetical protein [Paraburkholderia sp. WP4_3_2]MBB6104923.1 hypothetical protein [Paraburkholderia bannensis]